MEHMSKLVSFNLQYAWDSSVVSLYSFILGIPVLKKQFLKEVAYFRWSPLKSLHFFFLECYHNIQDQWFNLLFVVRWVQGLCWWITRCNSSNWNKSNTETLTAVSVATAESRECCGSSLSCQEQNDTSLPPEVLNICSYCHLIRLRHDQYNITDTYASICE